MAVKSVKRSLKTIVSFTGALNEVSDAKLPYTVVDHKTRVVSGALYGDPTGGALFRPKNPMSQPTGGFAADYENLA